MKSYLHVRLPLPIDHLTRSLQQLAHKGRWSIPPDSCVTGRDFRHYARFGWGLRLFLNIGYRGGEAVKRDIYKFLSGLFAGFAIEHAVTAIYLSANVFDLPQFLGRQWPEWSPWLGAALYAVISIGLGYLGWRKTGAAAP